MDSTGNCGCERKAVIKKSTMAISTESTKEGEEVIVRGQGWYMRLRALGSCAHILARLAIPAILSAFNVWLRSQRLILHHLSTHIHYAMASICMTFRFQAIGVFLIETKTKLKPLLWTDIEADVVHTEEERDIFCEVLYDPGPEVQADIIFIHGLKGSLYKTWKQGLWDSNNRSDIRWTKLNTSNNNEEEFESKQDQDPGIFEPDDDPTVPGEYSKCWPRDWLPLDCPGVRIIAVNYSTDPFLWKPFWIPSQQRLPMKERGREMMNQLLQLGVGSHPIVWVGHSKGGLFVKQMLVHAFESENPSDIAVCSNSKAILFYSVPHRGSPLASIDFPLLTRSIELREVMADSLEVQYLQDKFQHLLNSNLLQVKIKSFIETKLTLMTIVYLRIVSVESADLGIGELYGVPLDHRDICKPKSRYCFLYRELVRLINSVVQPTVLKITVQRHIATTVRPLNEKALLESEGISMEYDAEPDCVVHSIQETKSSSKQREILPMVHANSTDCNDLTKDKRTIQKSLSYESPDQCIVHETLARVTHQSLFHEISSSDMKNQSTKCKNSSIDESQEMQILSTVNNDKTSLPHYQGETFTYNTVRIQQFMSL